MELSIYDIIKGPVITSKAQELNIELNRLVLQIHPKANKPMVKEAIEKLFNVKVENVRVIIRKGKRRMVGKKEVWGKLQKKAIVKLKDGYKLNVFDSNVTASEKVQ